MCMRKAPSFSVQGRGSRFSRSEQGQPMFPERAGKAVFSVQGRGSRFFPFRTGEAGVFLCRAGTAGVSGKSRGSRFFPFRTGTAVFTGYKKVRNIFKESLPRAGSIKYAARGKFSGDTRISSLYN